MRGRNGSSPNIEVDDEEPPRGLVARVVSLELDAREGAEQRGVILREVSDVKRELREVRREVRATRPRAWSAKEWAVLAAAIAGALGTVMHALGK